MSTNSTLMTKFVLYKSPKNGKLLQDPYITYFGTIGSAREPSQPAARGGDCLTITSISPSKPLLMESQSATIRKTQNFRISNVSSNPSPNNSRLEEKNMRRLIQTRGSLVELPSEKIAERKISGSMTPAITGFRERIVRKEKEKDLDKEKKREEMFRITTQLQSQKENKQQPKQTQLTEQDKRVVLRMFQPVQKEQLSDGDKRKITTYFRYKIFSIMKIVEDKTRNSIQSIAKNEAGLIDEIWKCLKSVASTKSRYKCRDIVTYNKKLRETLKELFPASSPRQQKKLTTISLDDETPRASSKKSKSPDSNKASALGEFIIRKKETPSAKVFIIIGGYPALKKALEERGWIENPDPSSKDFNLKWSSKVDMKYDSLKPYQYVNHFERNTVITTKIGLTRSMRNLVWYDNEDIDQFFPRCYDVNDAVDFDDFLQDFKFEQAIATLRLAKNKYKGMSIPAYNLFKLKLCLSLSVCERRLKPFDVLLNDIMKNEVALFTQEEWELMGSQDIDNNILNDIKYAKTITSLKRRYGFDYKEKIVPEHDESLFIQAQATLARLEKVFPQVLLNQGKNIWIVKPAGLSRGRGICCHNSLPDILDHIKIRESEWVAQKYIENPLIIKKRKFDIRQWVLVTDWSPLTIWFYDECYIRFTAQDFNPEDLTNKFAHLTNNAIGKNAINFETSEIEGNMWDSNEFQTYLKNTTGKDVFEDVIKPQMKHIIVKTLLSGQDMLDSRKNCFELYGYDFMIDEGFKTWVLEINSSPSMDYSTSVTERLVQSVLADCVRVVVDYGMAKGENKRNVNTGNFQCIYSGKTA